ncbi:hypothetical protein LIER_41943 [Lithospermum erythrorhizon]|uniref:Uncharacterized protein n=1 Tax=Lithospermum erythrorhizon TaxID=34254 RepID=A0AAV3RKZ1_LITER
MKKTLLPAIVAQVVELRKVSPPLTLPAPPFTSPSQRLRLILLLSLPFFYFLVSHLTKSFVLDFIFVFGFSVALFISLHLAFSKLLRRRGWWSLYRSCMS